MKAINERRIPKSLLHAYVTGDKRGFAHNFVHVRMPDRYAEGGFIGQAPSITNRTEESTYSASVGPFNIQSPLTDRIREEVEETVVRVLKQEMR